MPIPPAHPAAALMLKRLSPSLLYLPALVVGSLVPDLATSIDDWEYFSHSARGSIVFCLPVGLLTLKLFHVLRRPIVLALPNPHRDALLPLCASTPPSAIRTILSLLIAVWAHIAWDLFTHDHSWLLPRISLMMVSIGGVPVHRLLWAFSSLGGLAFLVIFYLRFVLRRRDPGWSFSTSDLSAYLRWCAILMLPLIGAIPRALIDPNNIQGLGIRPLAMYYMGWWYLTIMVTGFILKSRGAACKSRAKSSSRCRAAACM